MVITCVSAEAAKQMMFMPHFNYVSNHVFASVS